MPRPELMLDSKRILVVEDEPIIAMALEEMLETLGCSIAGSAHSLETAFAMAETVTADAAILDLNLNGSTSFEVAAELSRRGIPYLFATGYGEAVLDARPANVSVVHKPYGLDEIDDALTALFAAGQSERLSPK